MTTESDNLAIVFSDICGSTRLYELLGDERARRLISCVLAKLEQVVAGHRGTVIKSIGDEVLCTFPSAGHAVDASIEMNLATDRIPHPDGPDVGPINLHTGLHLGPVVWSGDDVFGDAVNVAARIVSQAKPRQILTTGPTVAQLGPDHADSTRCIDKTTLRGQSREFDIYEVVWESHEVTQITNPEMIERITEALKSWTTLELRMGEATVAVELSQPCATLGRLEQNDLTVVAPPVSRYHARVEHRRGKFVLIDQSSNGTYVTLEGGSPLFVRREEVPLVGSGIIGLGEELTGDSPRAVCFEVLS